MNVSAAAASPTATRRPGSTKVEPSRRVRGTVEVPGDKSISHRAALFNAIADGEASVTHFSPGADCASTLDCLTRMGVTYEQRDDLLHVHGVGMRGLKEPADVLDCGNSGTTMRLLSGLLAGQGLYAVLTGDDSLRQRPMRRIIDPLRTMGASLHGRKNNQYAPLTLLPHAGLRATEHLLSVASAQLKSSLLLAGLYADGPVTVVERAPTRDHTERMLRAMGARVEVNGPTIVIHPPESLQAVDLPVPGDFSSAAFWLTLGVLHPDAEVRVRDVGMNPTRTGFLTILEDMGANVEVENAREEAGEPVADLVASSSQLRGMLVDGDLVALSIDELPLVALLGTFAEGETIVRDARELRVKESDRIASVAEGLNALGGNVQATEDGWEIRPAMLQAGRARSHGDHRLAMLLALAGTLGQGVEIEGAEAVTVSYPTFWRDLASVTGQ